MRLVAGVDVCVRCGNGPPSQVCAAPYDLNVTEVDMDQPHGELYIDCDGDPHFICHTPPNVDFEGLRTAIEKWIMTLEDQIERKDECPLSDPTADLVTGVK